MKIAGIDEAGKGPVIGPMCVAGVMVGEEELSMIEELGVKDSKSLSPKRREFLAGEIEKIAEIFLLEVTASQIDELRKGMTMNDIAVASFAKVLGELHPDKAFVDAVDVKPERFGLNIKSRCQFHLEIVSEHKSDKKYPIVSAASIVAKVRRDQRINELEGSIGRKIGSGYPSDPKTRNFLKKLVEEDEELPNYIRNSWKTVDNLKESSSYEKLI
ncbi:MAG: ribonuclease HII [Halobacteriota archaeon]|nr:ribonuclease HII [Halobacteriota archaeon]